MLWEERNELYVGHADGIICVFDLSLREIKNPVCIVLFNSIVLIRGHLTDITSIKKVRGFDMIATGSKDRTLKVITFLLKIVLVGVSYMVETTNLF